jgi:hypothetical protein
MRNKLKDQERVYETKLDVINKKVQMQMKEIAQLSKSQKRVKESVRIEKETINSSDNDSTNT